MAENAAQIADASGARPSGGRTETLWNSLEVAKLVASLLFPVAVAVLAFVLTQQGHQRDIARDESLRVQARQTAREEAVAQKRVRLWDRLGPLLSRIDVAFSSPQALAPETTRAVRADTQEARTLLGAFEIYFPKGFVDEVMNYLVSVDEAAADATLSDNERAALRQTYQRVVNEARSALGVPRS